LQEIQVEEELQLAHYEVIELQGEQEPDELT
jgi:hypothetical protein